jgi:hypothetical protein
LTPLWAEVTGKNGKESKQVRLNKYMNKKYSGILLVSMDLDCISGYITEQRDYIASKPKDWSRRNHGYAATRQLYIFRYLSMKQVPGSS